MRQLRSQFFPERDGHLDEPISLNNGPSLVDLIWSYWHEEGLLVQTMDAITSHLQDQRGPGDHDPLAHLNVAPLRPLNNLLWGFIVDDVHRLSAKRRAYEYQHQYGWLSSARQPGYSPRMPALQGFRRHFAICCTFPPGSSRARTTRTVVPDGAPLLQALKEVNLALAEDHITNRRPALDSPCRDDGAAMVFGASRDSRLPGEPGKGSLLGSLDAAGRDHEEFAKLVWTPCDSLS